ncbi:hypothetical protein [Flavobacterium johnsoniae]|uniref:Uncharacterized protein n=1 Tax=Flavobacterium johnsoniae TaxID=986 RepID=A0A1M5UI74_FLAJO|nr:hypothetical protein [Flavobacterium johnsoniae]SHH62598.1 hypothetical protein SAMN05444388_1143 [Flavobacterium johnsoniae]
MNKIASKILQLKPITLVMIFIIIPLISAIITGIMELIGIFADFEFVFPLILISATIAGIVYLVWVWGIIYHLEEKEESDKLYFKISYGIFFFLLFDNVCVKSRDGHNKKSNFIRKFNLDYS